MAVVATCAALLPARPIRGPNSKISTNEASGNSQASANSSGSVNLTSILCRAAATSPFQFLALIHVDRGVVVVVVQRDGQRHGSLGRGQHDHEQGDHLAVEPDRSPSRPARSPDSRRPRSSSSPRSAPIRFPSARPGCSASWPCRPRRRRTARRPPQGSATSRRVVLADSSVRYPFSLGVHAGRFAIRPTSVFDVTRLAPRLGLLNRCGVLARAR